MEHLNALASTFIHNALAESTHRNYRSCYRQYKRFCKEHAFVYSPLGEHILVLFCTFLATRNFSPVSVKSIKGYLSAIRYVAITKGFPTSLHGMDRLYYVLRGIKRYQGQLLSRPPRSPITTLRLTTLHGFINTLPISNHDRALYWSACTLAFFGLLRVSEYSCPKIKVCYPSHNLMLNDITFTKKGLLLVSIKASSKTD